MVKGKVSKNSRTSKKTTVDYTKRVKPKKETLLIELTEKVKDELVATDKYQGKDVIKSVRRFGKDYILVSNI